MNKKGFTLVELLATITIIGVVSLIGTASIMGVRSKIEANMFASKLALAIGAAQSWGEDNKGALVNNTSTCGASTNPCIKKTFTDLIHDGYLSADDDSGNIFDNAKVNIKDTQVKIYSKNSRIYACVSIIKSTDSVAIEKYDDYKCS